MDHRTPLYGVELARLKNLSSEPRSLRKLHFRLVSDAFPARRSALDLYIPAFHRYDETGRPHDPSQFVQHLDVTSTWKGLSITQAQELEFWEEMFAAVLEYLVSNRVMDVIDGMDRYTRGRPGVDLDSRICDFVNTMGSKTFPINSQDLITGMIELYRRHGIQHHWLSSGSNLHNVLCDFLRTRDCFSDTPLYPTIVVSLSATKNARGEPTITGCVSWRGPIIAFDRLQALATEKSDYQVVPYYTEPMLDQTYHSYLGKPEYYLASDWISFDWDRNIEGFRGFVPPAASRNTTFSYVSSRIPELHHTPLDLTAVISRYFPSGVRYERKLRVRIRLAIQQLRLEAKSLAKMPSGHGQSLEAWPQEERPCYGMHPDDCHYIPILEEETILKPVGVKSKIWKTRPLSTVTTASFSESLPPLERCDSGNQSSSKPMPQDKPSIPTELKDLSSLMRDNKRGTKSPVKEEVPPKRVDPADTTIKRLFSEVEKLTLPSTEHHYISDLWKSTMPTMEHTDLEVYAVTQVVSKASPLFSSPSYRSVSRPTPGSPDKTCEDSSDRSNGPLYGEGQSDMHSSTKLALRSTWDQSTPNVSDVPTQQSTWCRNVPAWSNWMRSSISPDQSRVSSSYSCQWLPQASNVSGIEYVARSSYPRSCASSGSDTPLEIKYKRLCKGKRPAESLTRPSSPQKHTCQYPRIASGHLRQNKITSPILRSPGSNTSDDTLLDVVPVRSGHNLWDSCDYSIIRCRVDGHWDDVWNDVWGSSSQVVQPLPLQPCNYDSTAMPQANSVTETLSEPRSSDSELVLRRFPPAYGIWEHYYTAPNSPKKSVNQQQVDIKEWYDAMALKKDVEQSCGCPSKRTAEEQSDVEAFEQAFLGNSDGGYEEVDFEDNATSDGSGCGEKHK